MAQVTDDGPQGPGDVVPAAGPSTTGPPRPGARARCPGSPGPAPGGRDQRGLLDRRRRGPSGAPCRSGRQADRSVRGRDLQPERAGPARPRTGVGWPSGRSGAGGSTGDGGFGARCRSRSSASICGASTHAVGHDRERLDGVERRQQGRTTVRRPQPQQQGREVGVGGGDHELVVVHGSVQGVDDVDRELDVGGVLASAGSAAGSRRPRSPP